MEVGGGKLRCRCSSISTWTLHILPFFWDIPYKYVGMWDRPPKKEGHSGSRYSMGLWTNLFESGPALKLGGGLRV